MIYPRHFVRLIDGRRGDSATVAFLPGSIGAHLNTLQTSVKLETTYAKKLLKHGINYYMFSEIQNTIDNGVCMLEPPNLLSFLFVKDKIKPIIFALILKTDRTRMELWLVTFHRITKQQYSKRLKPHQIIRDHADEEFMG